MDLILSMIIIFKMSYRMGLIWLAKMMKQLVQLKYFRFNSNKHLTMGSFNLVDEQE